MLETYYFRVRWVLPVFTCFIFSLSAITCSPMASSKNVQSWMDDDSALFTIRPRPCNNTRGESGVCMFNFECYRKAGLVIDSCIDRFMFGACCKLDPSEKTVAQVITAGVAADVNLRKPLPSSLTTKQPTSNKKTTASSSKVIVKKTPTSKPKVTLKTTSKPTLTKTKTTPATVVKDSTTKKLTTKTPVKKKPTTETTSSSTTTTSTKAPKTTKKTTTTTVKPTTTTTKTTTTTTKTTTTTEKVTRKSTTTTKKPTTKKPTTKKPTTKKPTTATTTKRPTTKKWDYTKHCGVIPLQSRLDQQRRFSRRQGRIVGGETAYFAAWPWQVLVKEATFLGLFTKNKCGGVLVNSKFVLTAAHCQPGFLATLIAVFGDFDIMATYEPKSSYQRNVRRIIVHRDFNALTFENDLALLELDRPVVFDEHVVPICLPEKQDKFEGRMATVTGWGKTTFGGAVPDKLMQVTLPVIGNRKCQDWFDKSGHTKRIVEGFQCAGYQDGIMDSCEGDSGGPLVAQREDDRWVLVGTVSHGIKCAWPNLPGIYMRMPFYRDWLDKHMKS